MDESAFLTQTDAIFEKIQHQIDKSGLDIEPSQNGNVLELEFADGSKIIVNRHTFNQEMWIAARSGGFHYRNLDGIWKNTRDEGEFFSTLALLISTQSDSPFTFEA
ncbi:iron donor protein CyaY [Parachitinimonas caeni]|uniref:Iron-sulfur cluster assembly protein CyaY n=1 Tax=Parachitinimonas caeni TaxID=3031301 RepID=A0ABT7E0A6_9NEIS|nr:iron donor protein CyaY [Parachitinimonas caeni]MDK2124778.1 iron donor protein CyaY [Parachitinimonas caeni]